jgi:hypothetical protein
MRRSDRAGEHRRIDPSEGSLLQEKAMKSCQYHGEEIIPGTYRCTKEGQEDITCSSTRPLTEEELLYEPEDDCFVPLKECNNETSSAVMDWQVNMVTDHPLVFTLAAEIADLLKVSHAINFLTLSILVPEFGTCGITIQRPSKKTPEMALKELTSEIERLNVQINNMAAENAKITSEKDQ